MFKYDKGKEKKKTEENGSETGNIAQLIESSSSMHKIPSSALPKRDIVARAYNV